MREAFLFVFMNQLFHLCNFLWFLEQVVVVFWEVQTLSFVPAIFLACVPKSGLWGGTLCQAKALLQTAHVCCQTWCNLQVKLLNPFGSLDVPPASLEWSLCILFLLLKGVSRSHTWAAGMWLLLSVGVGVHFLLPQVLAADADIAQGRWVPGGKNHFQINQF